jgi:hypothetical protein
VIESETADDPLLEGLRRDWIKTAADYAQVRVEWWLRDRKGRNEIDAHRSRLHDSFIDSCNALSRNMRARGKDVSWRQELGDDRKAIGDLACLLHALVGVRAR